MVFSKISDIFLHFQAFATLALLGLAAAAPTPDVSSHVISHGHGAVVSHGSHAPHLGIAHHGPIVHPVAHHAVHPVAHHAVHPVAHHAVHPVAHHAVHPVAHHAVHPVAHPVVHHAVHPVAHPVAHHAVVPAPAYAPAPAPYHPAPVVHHAPAYKPAPAPYVEPEGKDEPYAYQYGVADDYSKANFNAAETADGSGVVTGSYSVALPDGRTQHVKYTSDHYNGYVAEVTYEGVAAYPEAKPYAPAPAYHA